jgi:hypothetical protein
MPVRTVQRLVLAPEFPLVLLGALSTSIRVPADVAALSNPLIIVTPVLCALLRFLYPL